MSEVPLESWDPSPNEAWESDPQHRPTRSFSPQLAGEGASAPSNSDPSPQGSGTQTPPRGEPATPSHELGLLSQDMQSDTPMRLDPVSPVPSDGRETSSEGPLDTSCTPASHDIVVHSTLPLSGPSVHPPPREYDEDMLSPAPPQEDSPTKVGPFSTPSPPEAIEYGTSGLDRAMLLDPTAPPPLRESPPPSQGYTDEGATPPGDGEPTPRSIGEEKKFTCGSTTPSHTTHDPYSSPPPSSPHSSTGSPERCPTFLERQLERAASTGRLTSTPPPREGREADASEGAVQSSENGEKKVGDPSSSALHHHDNPKRSPPDGPTTTQHPSDGGHPSNIPRPLGR